VNTNIILVMPALPFSSNAPALMFRTIQSAMLSKRCVLTLV